MSKVKSALFLNCSTDAPGTFNKKSMCGAEATATIKRSEWGMTDGLKIGNPGDEIHLILPVEAYRDVS